MAAGYVSKAQIARAREIHVFDYVQSHDTGSVKRVGNGYRDIEHPSIAINRDGWYWHTQEVGGKTALDFLVAVRGYGFVDAVCILTGEKAAERSRPTPDIPAPERKPLSLPPRNANHTYAIAYLRSRGIAKPLILDCIRNGSVYESSQHHNCVFVGRDENGKARYAAMRGSLSGFKCDAQGSEKKYGFLLPPSNPGSKSVAVFESPIDALSHQTLCEQGVIPPFDGWRLSLGGTSTAALAYFIEQRPQITHCLCCTDDDEAGNKAAAKIQVLPDMAVERSPPPYGKDWNESLLALQKAECTQNRVRRSCSPHL